MSFKVIFYYEPYNRHLEITIPVKNRGDALRWVDDKIEKHDPMIPDGWTHWIVPNAKRWCEDELLDDS